MANLLDATENSIWHAFDFLALEGDGTAPKAKLKVRRFFFFFFSRQVPNFREEPNYASFNEKLLRDTSGCQFFSS